MPKPESPHYHHFTAVRKEISLEENKSIAVTNILDLGVFCSQFFGCRTHLFTGQWTAVHKTLLEVLHSKLTEIHYNELCQNL